MSIKKQSSGPYVPRPVLPGEKFIKHHELFERQLNSQRAIPLPVLQHQARHHYSMQACTHTWTHLKIQNKLNFKESFSLRTYPFLIHFFERGGENNILYILMEMENFILIHSFTHYINAHLLSRQDINTKTHP